MAVCLKPRLIRSGIETIKNIGNPEEMISELGILPSDHVLVLSKVLEIYKYYRNDIFTLYSVLVIYTTIFFNSTGITSGRTPRFLKETRRLRSRIKNIMKRMNTGKNIIWQTYTKQFWNNWKLNYEFIYKAYFMKIANLLKPSTER